MAFHWPTFRTRALTAIIFVAVMLVGLLWNEWSFLVLFSIMHAGCWWEYLRLLEKIYMATYHINFKMGLIILGYGLMLYTPLAAAHISDGVATSYYFHIAGLGSLNIPFVLLTTGTLLMMAGTLQQRRVTLPSFGAALLGLVYISLSWGLMLHLYQLEFLYLKDTMYAIDSGSIPIIVIASIWINDTMAYIVGSLIGKTPISKWSPKKTWEGTIGGIVLCIGVVGFVLPIWLMPEAGMAIKWMLACVAAVSAIMGTLGDLLESRMKRMAGVKDSGHFMPGHGGFLDRFDSLLLATTSVSVLLGIMRCC